MIKNCTNCGGKLYFSPKSKGNVCESCASVFPIAYNFQFDKKPFSENMELDKDELAVDLQNLKCSSCGANIMLNKYQLQTYCPYCGNTTIVKGKKQKLMYIDSLVPFAFSKAEALSTLKSTLFKKFYANKKVFKNLTEADINGIYVNTFVFDFVTSSEYHGTFSYTETERDTDGRDHTVTRYKNVSGFFDKKFTNVTVEANSKLEQKDLISIMPFDYSGAVEFQDDFLHGYMLEYQDKMFDECFQVAERIARKRIEDDLLRKYHCDRVENLSLNIAYSEKRYNYCLLPVYLVNRVVKDKQYKLLMNGQTGKIGRIPKDKLRVFLTILFVTLGFVAIALIFMFLP